MKLKVGTFALLLFIFLFFCLSIYGHFRTYYKSFNGKVEKITYDLKGYPIVTIQDKEHSLTFGRTDIQIIEVNDSIIKHKKSFFVEQYRNDKKIAVYKWRTLFVKEEEYRY